MIIANIDGGSRGNPGPAGYGVRVARDDGALVAELGEAIGVATNNVAEYRGLLAALRYALEQGYRDLTIRSDSLLLVCQMRGEYKVKNAGLQPLHAEARLLAARLGRVRYEHVPRERNTEADRLANEAMDGKQTEDRILNSESRSQNSESRSQNSEVRLQNPESGSRKPGSRRRKPEAGSWKLEF